MNRNDFVSLLKRRTGSFFRCLSWKLIYILNFILILLTTTQTVVGNTNIAIKFEVNDETWFLRSYHAPSYRVSKGKFSWQGHFVTDTTQRGSITVIIEYNPMPESKAVLQFPYFETDKARLSIEKRTTLAQIEEYLSDS